MRFKMLIMAAALAFAGTAGCDNAKTEKKSDEAKAEAPKEAKDANKEGEEKPAEKAEAKVELPIIAKGPVAKVNGVDIPAEDFNKEVSRLSRIAARLPEPAIEKFRQNTVDRLIDQKLVEDALNKTDLKHTDEELNKEMSRFMEKMGGEEGAKKFFEQSGITKEELREDIGRSIVLKKYLRKEYGIAVDDKKAKEFYEQNAARFTQEEQVKASHILFKVDKNASKEVDEEKKKKAKEILKKAKEAGADFAALAKENSEGPTAPRGGDLGFFPRKRMVPAFAEAAFKLKPGEITGPVKTEFGYHIIKVTDHKDKKVTSFEEAKADIVENLERTKMREAMDKLIKNLREGAKVEKLDKNIEKNPKFKPAPAQGFGMPGMPGMGGHPPMPKGGKAAPKAPTPAPPTPTK